MPEREREVIQCKKLVLELSPDEL